MFVDASALIAILVQEAGWQYFRDRMDKAERIFVSPISIWEGSRGLHRVTGMPLARAESIVRALISDRNGIVVEIGDDEASLAVDASARFGKGHHPAALNMGDCFAYACAKSLGVRLLAKGNDFPQTDIEMA